MEPYEAKRLILREWRYWFQFNERVAYPPTCDHAKAFFEHLATRCQDMLDFPWEGDRWQLIERWLREEGDLR